MFIVVKNDNTRIGAYNLTSDNYSVTCKSYEGEIEVKLSEIKSIIITSTCEANILISI